MLYAITAALVTRLAVGSDEVQQADQRGAIAAIAEQPFAGWLLALLTFGLFAFALWRFYDTFTGDDSFLNRAFHAVSGIAYSVLGFLAARVLLPGSDESGGDGTASTTARVMELPAGRVLVGLVGLGMVGIGGYFIVQGVSRSFMKKLDVSGDMTPWVTLIGVLGWIGRGVGAILTGGFVVQAALNQNPSEAKGLDAALKALIAESYGRTLLVTVAVGFAAYALLCFVEAKYRRYDD